MVTTSPLCPVLDLAVAMLIKCIAGVPDLTPKETLYLMGSSYTGTSEVSLCSSAFLSITTALTIWVKPMWIPKTSTYLRIACFAELLDFASRNISVFVTLPALVHSEPSADTALPGSCSGNKGISLQAGEALIFNKRNMKMKENYYFKWRMTLHLKKVNMRLLIKEKCATLFNKFSLVQCGLREKHIHW